MRSYYVYIMTNPNRTVLYVGVTNNLFRRVYEHQQKLLDGFTKKYNCVCLIYYEEASNIESAIAREKQIKGWTRAKKEALIDGLNPKREDLSIEYEMINDKSDQLVQKCYLKRSKKSLKCKNEIPRPKPQDDKLGCRMSPKIERVQ